MKTEKESRRKKINSSIRNYWFEIKKQLELSPVNKNFCPNFTRHNGRKIKRLSENWRYPKGSKCNTLTNPKIGYKRPTDLRFRRSSDGLLFRKITNEKDLRNLNLKKYEVLIFSSTLGARKRQLLLQKIKELKLPLYTPRIR